jgi:phage shock protein C
MEKKLYRNEHDKVVAGVSSGLAAYMQVDVTIIRILFVLSTIFLVGAGLLIYIIMWIIVPVNNDPNAKFSQFNEFFKQQNPNDIFNGPNAFSNPQNSGSQTKWNTENDLGKNADFENDIRFGITGFRCLFFVAHLGANSLFQYF